MALDCFPDINSRLNSRKGWMNFGGNFATGESSLGNTRSMSVLWLPIQSFAEALQQKRYRNIRPSVSFYPLSIQARHMTPIQEVSNQH